MRNLLTEINAIFRDVFESDNLVVDLSTTAADIRDWDSVQHVTLILRMEIAFGVRFTSAEVADMKSVGDLIDTIQTRLGGA